MVHIRLKTISIAIPLIAQLVASAFLFSDQHPTTVDPDRPGETAEQTGEIDTPISPPPKTPKPERPLPEQPDSLRKWAIAHYTQGRTDKALETFEQMARTGQDRIEKTCYSLSETERFKYLKNCPPIDDAFLSFALETHSEHAVQSALRMVLRGKEIRIDIFAEEKVGKEAGSFTIEEVAKALPEGSVLWEFVEFESYEFTAFSEEEDRVDPKSADDRSGTSKKEPAPAPRYLAFTLDRSGKVTLHDLGPAARIDSLVVEARRMIAEIREVDYLAHEKESESRLAEVTGALYGKTFKPLQPSLGQNKSILVSPDGRLNLIPFEILADPDGKYLIESYRISYLSSGQDLLEYRGEPKRTDWAMVLATPNFDLSGGAYSRKLERLMKESETFAMAYSSSRGASDCLETRFSQIRQTHFEANAVAMALEKRGRMRVEDPQGGDAMEEVVKRMEEPPRVLHLATHTFFCADQDMSGEGWLENPLLRSGLALAGANRMLDTRGVLVGEGEDGILTAYEVSGLNLTGTELAVLSACETVTAEDRIDRTLFGLRRAFLHAGAETIVMSLWRMPERETFRLMDRFYKNWLDGQGKQEALRGSTLDIIGNLRQRYGTAHPMLWGGFILVGNPD